MQIVEREGTGIKAATSKNFKLGKLTAVVAVSFSLCAGLFLNAHASQTIVTLDSCNKVSIGVGVDGQLLVGSSELVSGYALIELQPYKSESGSVISAAGEGTGSPGSVIQANGPLGDSAGEGTGSDSSSGSQVHSAGEGTGIVITATSEQLTQYSTNGSWGVAELAINDNNGADIVIYRYWQEAFTEQEVISNVAVSGLASGSGCDRK